MQDLWDSIQNNDYFSVEGAKDVIRQVDSITSHLLNILLVSLFIINLFSFSISTSFSGLLSQSSSWIFISLFVFIFIFIHSFICFFFL